jgi:small multidrug resistance family-3 protein
MRYGLAMMFLFLAALLEVGGDALMRAGINSAMLGRRSLFFAAGCIVLAAYGYTINAPSWDFGRLLGTYIAFFFVISQAIAWAAFGHKPTLAIACGGTLIVAGGLIISLLK